MPVMILAHEVLGAEASPERWMLVLHGILGRRANWRSFMRKWLKRRPGWGVALVDLRVHGDSQAFPPPHTLASAGDDLLGLSLEIGREHGGRVAGIMGHSFGAKVGIVGAAALRRAHEDRAVDELWVIDAPPGPRRNPQDLSTDKVFAALEAQPQRFRERSEFTAALVAAGLTMQVAQWLATNLVLTPTGWRFSVDLEGARALLKDFSTRDLWPELEAEAAAGTRVNLVVGGRSLAVSEAERSRAEALAARGILGLGVVEGAGHWIQVDAPEALLDVLCA